MAQYRAERLAHEIKRFMSEMIQFEMRDPRLHMASVTRVEVSHDLRHAKIFISAVTEEERDEAARVLQRARGFLRKGLAGQISLRVTPELQFVPDTAIAGGDRVLGIMRELEAQTQGNGE
jgi:ribosome-binding factor A